MIGENINQYTRFYPKDLSLHGIPTVCPQPLGRMFECSELTLGCSVGLNSMSVLNQVCPIFNY
ncbi:hypothetical protein Hanom_Chr00s159694g01824781 [Helianthus anomalus]